MTKLLTGCLLFSSLPHTVHERNLDTDILLALLKQTLPKVSHIRVILMSATLDADRFSAYWGKDTPRIRTLTYFRYRWPPCHFVC
jgi:hypothetical protein